MFSRRFRPAKFHKDDDQNDLIDFVHNGIRRVCVRYPIQTVMAAAISSIANIAEGVCADPTLALAIVAALPARKLRRDSSIWYNDLPDVGGTASTSHAHIRETSSSCPRQTCIKAHMKSEKFRPARKKPSVCPSTLKNNLMQFQVLTMGPDYA
jgi:hypothetical protein